MDSVTSRESLQNIIINSNVAIDSFTIKYNLESKSVESFVINSNLPEESSENHGYYEYNKEISKLVLVLDKDWYMCLDECYKRNIKSNFLFSRRYKAWVSRAKYPNLGLAEEVAKSLGLVKKDDVGNIKSFEDQMKDKAAKAEKRAERYEEYALNAEHRGKELQSPLNNMSGDIAFFTQPNINSSAGRAFTNYRERIFRSYEEGMDEFRKSEYYKDKALTAMSTASNTKPIDKAFIQRRIEECNSDIKKISPILESYYSMRDRLNKGETVVLKGGELLTKENLDIALNKQEELLERSLSKLVYYDKCMQNIGGVEFSKENIHKGDIVELDRWGLCQVISTGPKNIRYKILEGGARGLGGTASYASIKKIVQKLAIKEQSHPFNVGEEYEIERWNSGISKYEKVIVKIVKCTSKSVTLQIGNEKPIIRRPRKIESILREPESNTWMVSVGDGYRESFTKEGE